MKFLYTLALLFFAATQAFAQNGNYSIFPDLVGQELIDSLRANYSVTRSMGYTPARDLMFNHLHNKDGKLTGVYSGYTITFTNRQDAQNKGFNTEHTWPQGLFNKKEPMKSDIHHLFPVRMDANSARSNYPFAEIPDNLTTKWFTGSTNQTSIPSTNIDDYSELLANTSFEPREDHKGNVARSMFYFWTMYQNRANVADDVGFFNGMKDDLYVWHNTDLVDDDETARSLGIEAGQGNRNPFIQDTTLVRRAYFSHLVVAGIDGIITQPKVLILNQSYPNPFNPKTVISYSLAKAGFVQLKVFNTLGQEVSTLVNKTQVVGNHKVTFNATDLPSGVYLYQLNADGLSSSRKMLLIK